MYMYVIHMYRLTHTHTHTHTYTDKHTNRHTQTHTHLHTHTHTVGGGRGEPCQRPKWCRFAVS